MRILADLHTHTISSGHAYSTLTEIAQAAAKQGLKILGITDHGPSMPGAPNLYYFGNFSVIPKDLYGVQLLRGVEANIVSHEGELDIPIRYLRMMDLVLVGLHVICYPGGCAKQNTNAYLKAMNNPYTDMMVHPGRPEFDLDLDRIAFESAQLQMPVEINNSSLCPEKGAAWDNSRFFAKAMTKYGSPVFLGSDAHYHDQVGELNYALELVQEFQIPDSQILNTSPERIIAYLNYRRKKRPSVAKY